MESWRNGREELFEELTKICNRIDQNVVAEIDQENYTFIARDELRFLNEKSARVDALVEENGRLAEELWQHKGALMRMEILEKENKRLARELEKAVQRAHNVSTPTGMPHASNGAKSIPASSAPTSSTNAIENDETISETRKKYYTLVEKYNALHANFTDIKSARSKLEELSRKQKGKIKEWKTHADRLTREKMKLQQKSRTHKDNVEESNINLDVRGLESEAVASEVDILLVPEMRQPLPGQVPVSPAKDAQDFQNKTPRSESKLHTSVSPGPELLPRGYGEAEAEEEALELPIHGDRESATVDDTQFVELELEHTSSTQDDPLPESPRPVEDKQQVSNEDRFSSASQEPVVISCRSVKKRKSLHGRSQATPASKIKVEKIPSSPVGIAALHYLNFNDSIDLDEIGEKVDTPKKRRRMLELSRRASSLYDDLQAPEVDAEQTHSNTTDRSSSRSTSQNTPVPARNHARMESALQPLSANKQILPRTSSDSIAPRKRRLASDQAVEELVEDGQSISVSGASRKPGSVGPSERLGGLLEKLSPTKRVLSPLGLSDSSTASPRNHQARSKACATSGLAREIISNPRKESDGIRSNRFTARRSLEPSWPSSRESVQSRPTSKETPKPSTDPLRHMSAHNMDVHKGLARAPRELPWLSNNNTPISASKGSVRKSVEQVSPPKGSVHRSAEIARPSTAKARPVRILQDVGLAWDDHPDNEPLRARPHSMLKIGDFKINPNHNQGYDYAFRDVVRGRDQRRCLPGCTKPDCCGNQFRVLAEQMNKEDFRTASQEAADEQLLEDFLGNNAYKLQNMNKVEKAELLLKARTRELANQFGKHRHAYERRKSPPGFWDTDFPTTQEHMATKEQEKQYERDLIAKRYEEAMRPGGAYLFRDE
ncbi:DNA repair protein endonuclease SAE2/CtIP C-terminus-domain-containing protein [Halenospora varia]|nr:DNA repair protein endonuclease SAE2/CtIP C-terminus-domain-containing protein [Halenospora varia]